MRNCGGKMKFILIIMLGGGFGAGNITVTEFSSIEQCNIAAKWVIESATYRNNGRDPGNISVGCFRKASITKSK